MSRLRARAKIACEDTTYRNGADANISLLPRSAPNDCNRQTLVAVRRQFSDGDSRHHGFLTKAVASASTPPLVYEAGLAPGGARPTLDARPDERELLGNKTGAARLSFAVLLKAFQFEGRFPKRREDVAGSVVVHLASQTGVPSQAHSEGEWSERTQRRQRARIRKYCGSRVFRTEDEPALVKWLSEHVASPNPETEAFKASAYSHLRSQQIEPPAIAQVIANLVRG